jgi:transposase-like protein
MEGAEKARKMNPKLESAARTVRETEVPEKTSRRRFTAEYKRKILNAAAACTKVGELGAMLRREGLYSSHLTAWRRQLDLNGMNGLAGKKRGPQPKRDDRDKRITELERENNRLRFRAERAEALVDIQKKVSLLLGVELDESGRPRS